MKGRDRFLAVGKCHISGSARICVGAIIGKRFRPLLGVPSENSDTKTTIGSDVYVGCYSLVGSGTVVKAGCVIDDFSVVECDVTIRESTLLIYRAQVCNEARIGRDCVIGGFVGERVVVGDECRIFGQIVHSQHNPRVPWDSLDVEEGSAKIADRAFVGFGAVVAGKIRIGTRAYICAGAVVTQNVPPLHIASGVNKIVHHSVWSGPLAHSAFFRK